jgi:hypothetical protein
MPGPNSFMAVYVRLPRTLDAALAAWRHLLTSDVVLKFSSWIGSHSMALIALMSI